MMISSYGRAGLMYSVLPFLSPFRRLALLSLFFFFFFSSREFLCSLCIWRLLFCMTQGSYLRLEYDLYLRESAAIRNFTV